MGFFMFIGFKKFRPDFMNDHNTNMDVFQQIDLRVGTIELAKVFEEARKPAYLLEINFGPDIGILRSSAQITELYTADELKGKQVIAVTNLPPKQIGPVRSECLVTGFYVSDGKVVLAVPDKPAINGSKLC